jgi:diacylglycerol kinase family enzyme
MEILQLLIGMDTGDHVNHPRVETFKCKAYRLEPLRDSDGGLYTLDGEMIGVYIYICIYIHKPYLITHKYYNQFQLIV